MIRDCLQNGADQRGLLRSTIPSPACAGLDSVGLECLRTTRDVGRAKKLITSRKVRHLIGAAAAAASSKPRYREVVQNGQIIFVERGGGFFASSYTPSKIVTAPIVVVGPSVVVKGGYCGFGTKIGSQTGIGPVTGMQSSFRTLHREAE